jgi:hypothetical protein
MKRQELRACFDRIQPREELIRSTLEGIRGVQENNHPVCTMPTYAFATRLAGAACALVLLVGVGVSLGRNVVVAPDALLVQDERVSPMTADAMDGVTAPREVTVGGELVGCEDMLKTAKSLSADAAVCTAAVDAVYFKSETEGFATIRPLAVADGSYADWIDAVDGELTLVAAFDATNEELRSLVDRMGSEVLVGLHTETRDGETVWVIHELHAQETAVE